MLGSNESEHFLFPRGQCKDNPKTIARGPSKLKTFLVHFSNFCPSAVS